ncbi:hypothetical protein T12_15525 [Trichinella patagoniensis]|uniref:Secreted protein n=1 Tax=Trichinella patagoniensis TaxID=990121 RepID=A0A0V1ADZ1_9BILA|nr:hypothetical protein T12_15525 [Trichinella patagoniensis]
MMMMMMMTCRFFIVKWDEAIINCCFACGCLKEHVDKQPTIHFCTTPSVEKPIALCRLVAGHLQSSQLFSSQSRQFEPIERRSCACMQYAVLK